MSELSYLFLFLTNFFFNFPFDVIIFSHLCCVKERDLCAGAVTWSTGVVNVVNGGHSYVVRVI